MADSLVFRIVKGISLEETRNSYFFITFKNQALEEFLSRFYRVSLNNFKILTTDTSHWSILYFTKLVFSTDWVFPLTICRPWWFMIKKVLKNLVFKRERMKNSDQKKKSFQTKSLAFNQWRNFIYSAHWLFNLALWAFCSI